MMMNLFFILLFSCLEACTAFQLSGQDGSLVYARTLEFGIPLDSNLLIVPRGTEYVGSAPGGRAGLKWRSRYGYVGLNQSLDRTVVSDGMNEKGLVVGMLYLPGYAKYEAFDPSKTDRALGSWEVASFLLSMCASIQEAKKILPTVLITNEPAPEFNFTLPLHYYIGDKTGAVITVEYVNGKRRVYDNPVTALTNSPPFDWQLTNLSNYVDLSPKNASAMKIGKIKVENFSQGSGALGLPGDYTAPSRFVRAALYSHWAIPAKEDPNYVRLGFHILNTFDIFEGAIQSNSKKNSHTDTTQWVIVHDQINLETYFRTYESLSIQMIDLKSIDFNQPGFKQIPLAKRFRAENVTSQARPSILPSRK